MHCVKQKCQHMAGSRDQDVDGHVCAVRTTAPLEKRTTHWPLSNIHRHHPLAATAPQQGGSGEHSRTRALVSVLVSVLRAPSKGPDKGCCLASCSPIAGQHLRSCPRVRAA